VRHFLRRKARWLAPLAGILALLTILWTVRSGLSWVDEESERDRLRAEFAQAKDALAELETCILGGPKSPNEWLPHAVFQQYAPHNPKTHLRLCQELIPATGFADVKPWTAVWVNSATVDSRLEPDTACDYLTRAQQRLHELGTRAGLSPSPPPFQDGSCKPDNWPLLEDLVEPSLPDVPRERVVLTGFGFDERGRLNAHFAYQGTAYGVNVREQVRTRYHDGSWHYLHEPLDALTTYWSDEDAISVTRGAPQALWLPERASTPVQGNGADHDDTSAGQTMTWTRTAFLPEQLQVQDLRLAVPSSIRENSLLSPESTIHRRQRRCSTLEVRESTCSVSRLAGDAPRLSGSVGISPNAASSERALTLVAVHRKTRQWFALFGDPATGILAEPVPLTPVLAPTPADSRPREPGARASFAQRVGLGQYCRSSITPAGHVVLACLAHGPGDASALHIYRDDHRPASGADVLPTHAFELPSAIDAEVIDTCVSGETVWLATRLSWLFVSRDSGKTFARHAMPLLADGSSRCDLDTWSWFGDLSGAGASQKPTESASYHTLSCAAETGCAAPIAVAGHEVERVLTSTDGAALLLLAFARGGPTGAVLLERTAPGGVYSPASLHRVDRQVSQRRHLGWQIGRHRFIESDSADY
jgi:hypothetical protein